MHKGIDLIWLGEDAPPEWSPGEISRAVPSPAAVHQLVEAKLASAAAEAWLFWDSRLGSPSVAAVENTLHLPGHVWHAGLSLGTGGQPDVLDFVEPTWTFNRDPSAGQTATSWRLSLSACLVRTDVLRRLGDVDARFQTLEAAALEMGHRYITHGVFTRHVPDLIHTANALPSSTSIPLADEMRFLYNRFKRWQCEWALLRMILSGYATPTAVLRTWRTVRSFVPRPRPQPYRPGESADSVEYISTSSLENTDVSAGARHALSRPYESQTVTDANVSVIIPTLHRYPYLRTLLGQLRDQTIPPAEIIVIDQTSAQERDLTLERDFAELPLRVVYQDQPGQCSSRNRGLEMASGDYVLFVDDDDEVTRMLIEAHLLSLRRFDSEVSCGVAEEVGAGALPENFTYTRMSDVFPTNNSLIARDVLRRSGLFDLAYERGQRADSDLGMRIYLSGALMVLQPEISVLHHHAASGGLRAHKARKITYASSRQRILQRHLPSVSEIYLARRYFTPRQVRESLWLRVFGTFSLRGSRKRKIAKVLFALFLLPNTCWRIYRRNQQVTTMLDHYPQIPALPADESVNASRSSVAQP